MKRCRRKERKEQGITLIALVITIIVLLILAAISIATLTGENGVLTKASEAGKNTDIAETKEQIKLELIGNYDKNKTNYTNTDVINAVKKITGKDVTENTATVQSEKGNYVDISDLWTEGEELWNIPIEITWSDSSGRYVKTYILRHAPIEAPGELIGVVLEDRSCARGLSTIFVC